jgi:hypothetical protein
MSETQIATVLCERCKDESELLEAEQTIELPSWDEPWPGCLEHHVQLTLLRILHEVGS